MFHKNKTDLQKSVCFVHFSKSAELINQLFVELERSSENTTLAQFSNENKELDLVLDHLVGNRRFSLKQIADIIGYSTRNTARLILNKYKMSLSEKRRRLAIDTAKILLEDESRKMSEIATLSGFKNTTALRNAFLKHENMTPAEYRSTFEASE